MNHETDPKFIVTDDGFSEKKSALLVEDPTQTHLFTGTKVHKKRKKKEVTLFIVNK